MAAGELAAALGARVIAARRTAEKLAVARERGGATDVVGTDGLRDTVKALTGRNRMCCPRI